MNLLLDFGAAHAIVRLMKEEFARLVNQQKVLASAQEAVVSTQPAWLRALANRNFRLLWLGESLSLFGDQFYVIALPWLVFQMTGSSLAFGTVLMVAGIPRAVLLLVGGVMTDRFSPRAIMLASNLLRLAITVLLTLFVVGQTVQLWLLYVIAFCFGVVDAFFHPAYRAMAPMIVKEDDLQASNSLMLGTSHFMQIAGPGVAGVLVRSLGMALAFAFDALTFLFSAIMLMLMRPPAQPGTPVDDEPPTTRRSVLTEIGAMLAFVRADRVLPTIILVIAAVNLLFVGPLVVGTATLGQERFAEGAAAFGAMLSVFSIGMLAGTLAAGTVRTRRAGVISLLLVAGEGALMIGVAHAPTLPIACGLWLLIGFGAGFGNVTVITLTQTLVTKDMMGRFMSLVVLAEVGLTPVSNALAGLIADVNVTALFVLAGGLLSLTALLALTNRDLRAGIQPA
jgi:MFS family permease